MSIFPTKILLATDGSEEAEMAATTAVNLANNTNSELHILTVAPGYPCLRRSHPGSGRRTSAPSPGHTR